MKKSLVGVGVKLKGLLGKKKVGGYQRECVTSEEFYEKQSEVNFHSRKEEEGRGGKKRKKRIG